MGDHAGAIRVLKARVHNLKELTVDIPRQTLTVITGVSGSGKSSLAFDTIHAEGQRRYVESLSSYARQFLEQLEKPDVESIEGLSPTIAIEQKATSKNPRSTVGTVTEIYDYFRLLFAAVGTPHCPKCDRPVESSSAQEIVERLLPPGWGDGPVAPTTAQKVTIYAPIVRGRKGEFTKVIADLKAEGFARIRLDGQLYSLDDELPKLNPKQNHSLDVAIDRMQLGTEGVVTRLTDAVELALKLAEGLVTVDRDGTETLFSEKLTCPTCDVSLPDLKPRLFSFNAPYGACPTCHGLGFTLEVDPDLVIPDRDKPLNEGAIVAFGMAEESILRSWINALAKHCGFKPTTPVRSLSEKALHALLHGTTEAIEIRYEGKTMQATMNRPFEGLLPMLRRRHSETQSEGARTWYQKFMRTLPCGACAGKRLAPAALAVRIQGRNIHDLTTSTVGQLQQLMADLPLDARQAVIVRKVMGEINARLGFLVDVGLDYLTLDRAAQTLSGGEAQRIRLATQIGSALVGITYVLDEPSIGLHPRDNRRLIATLKRLRDLGNTVLVVEHDHELMSECDHLIDLGPGAGKHGGTLVAEGTPAEVTAMPHSLTGRFLAGTEVIPTPSERRSGNKQHFVLHGATHNNLKGIDLDIPLGKLVVITGVSGSGKSSLISDTLYPLLANKLNGARHEVGAHRGSKGLEFLNKVINIDQSPIGRTPRSNPATYTGVFTPIRTLFAETTAAKSRGFSPGRFSFNVKGGRCENCEGSGQLQIEMHFLPDVFVTCDVCHGSRFNSETLKVQFKGKNIAEVLALTVDDALELFSPFTTIRRRLETLADVGLGYITLGQAATTLSGGEAQRIKLAAELSKIATGQTLYILDEPTTGLHFADVRCLLTVLARLVDKGNTVVLIEHNLEVIKTADWIIDLGPEGGARGGEIVVCGTPEQVAAHPTSYTGAFLRELLATPAPVAGPTRNVRAARARPAGKSRATGA